MKKNRAIVVLLLTAIITVFLCYTAGIGLGPTGTGSAKNIKTGLDLSGGVSITYQAKESSDIRRMFAGRTGLQGYDAWMQAFCNRKYESAFSREMNRSMEIYLKPFLEKEGVSDLEK